jgi:hypothetical protein
MGKLATLAQRCLDMYYIGSSGNPPENLLVGLQTTLFFLRKPDPIVAPTSTMMTMTIVRDMMPVISAEAGTGVGTGVGSNSGVTVLVFFAWMCAVPVGVADAAACAG